MQDKKILLAADSFLVKLRDRKPHSVYLEEHLERFTNSCQSQFFALDRTLEHQKNLDAFLVDSRKTLAKITHDSFPRLDCYLVKQNVNFEFQNRTAPALKDFLAVAAIETAHFSDRWVKGPNIKTYAGLNQAAGGEVLLGKKDGTVLETTTAALVWWRANTLFTVPHYLADKRVGSITEKAVKAIALSLGFEVKEESVSVQELAELEVWGLNALHGIRPVTSIVGREISRNAHRLNLFKAEYEKTFSTITQGAKPLNF